MPRLILALAALLALAGPAPAQQQPVNTGTGPNSGTGDSLRDAFGKLNANDADLYARSNALSTALAGKAASIHTHVITDVTGLSTALAARLQSANNLSDLASPATARGNLGLGSIAVQGAGSVTITGGTINGVAIGGTTPAAGAFTTLSATTPLPVTSGGTGGNTASAARSGLGAAASGANSDLTSLSGLTTPLSAAQGGTGATSLSSALDTAYGSAQGSILYRGASTWAALSPGTSGQVLTSGGAGAGPSWAAPSATSTPPHSYAAYTANAALTTTIPFDDTIPQITEGTEILSTTITPRTTASRLRVRFEGQAALSGSGTVSAAVFVNGAASAVRATTAYMIADAPTMLAIEHEFVPGSTSLQTISVRVGPNTGTARMNGTSSARVFGGASAATLVVEELP